jgi:hypothetical protein
LEGRWERQKNRAGRGIEQKLTKTTEVAREVAIGELDKIMVDKIAGRLGSEENPRISPIFAN